MRVWRLTRAAHLDDLLTGESARRFGGRWNSRGTACVYASVSLELNLPTSRVAPWRASLPEHWDQPPPCLPATQEPGDTWLRSGSSLALRVPSAVLPQRQNV